MKADRTRRTKEPDEEEAIGLAGRAAAAVRARPKAVLLTLASVFSLTAISVNALYLQPGKHPAPMFSHQPAPVRTASLSDDVAPAPATLPATSAGQDRETAPAPPPDNMVAAIQTALKARGLYSDAVDGAMGPATRAAISAYEQKMGLDVTGAPSLGLLASLSGPATKPPSAPSSTASQGSSTPSRAVVQRLQKALVAAGYGPITVDGLYGSETAGAIRRYQLDHGMSVNGNVSDPLLAKLGVVAGQPEG
ncbi:peptidoglycan hydrolase-like protein with peptidoglycan-binding domain [Amorphus suaedae]